ncbi:MAG: outer membrane protein transport protein [Chthoniobacter sp.]|nr:outer membrane protein transport protein [Chthoniobacter sp.]
MKTNPLICVATLFALSAPTAFSLGFRIADQNAEATARGNAFAATADNPSAVFYNPAGITQLEGTRALLGSYATTLRERVDPAAPGAPAFSNTNHELQFVPTFFATTKAKDFPLAFGVGVYAPYGLGLEYPDDTPFRTLARKGKIVYLTINPVVAWKITDTLSVAVGPTVNYGSAELQQGVLATGDTFKFKGDGISYGITAGLKWDPHRMHHFGITYHGPTTIDFSGHTTLRTDPFTVATPFGPFPVAGIDRREDADARFHIPQNVVLGYSFTPTPDWNFEFNADWTDWNDLNTVTLHQQRSGNVALPFNWQASWFWEFGITKKFTDGWQASIGYIWSENSVPETSFNPIVPDSNRHVLSAGFGQKRDRFNWNIAYQWAYGPTRTINQGTSADGRYRAQGNAINLTFGYDF